MADEPKVPPEAAKEGGAPAPKTGGEAPPSSLTSSPAAGPAGGPSVLKPPAATPPKSAAAVKAPLKPEPWSSPLLEEIHKKFPGAISEAVIFRGMPSLVVAMEALVGLCRFLKSEEGGTYTLLTDETAVDYPKREKRFDIVYHLYSFKGNDRLRLKVVAGEGERVPSVVSVWPTADWLEREVYDMFGVVYDGHPDLKRILLPDEWSGHPLRKDYDILRQDDAWVKANLKIESGQ